MEYHIDRRVILSPDSQHKSLYKWSLQELDADGKKVGRDQIPWAWGLYFMATEIAFTDDFEIGRDYGNDDIEKKAIREQKSITAKLSPGRPWDRGIFDDTVYSMFGTDRVISDFFLNIVTISEEEQQESCMAWGCVSYTAEVDFLNETTPDTVHFYLRVRPETFARYVGAIAASEVDEVVFRVSQVSGFYSNWSPAISTNRVKVLTRGTEHEVEIPREAEIDPPRLGAVGEVQLYLRRINQLKTALAETPDEDDEWHDKENVSVSGKDDEGKMLSRLMAANAREIKLLSSLRIAAWVIAIVLFFILMKMISS